MNSATQNYETVKAVDSGVVYFHGSSEGSTLVTVGSEDFHNKMSVIGAALDRGPSSVMYLGGTVTGMQDDELRAWLDFGTKWGAFRCLDADREIFVSASYED